MLSKLTVGITCSKGKIICKEVFPGRSYNEWRTQIFFDNGSCNIDLMDVLLFSGFNSWYHPWIEIMYPDIFEGDDGKTNFSYFDSTVEEELIGLFCRNLPSAGKIFVSYESDNETRKGLMVDIPPQLTRLGFLLFMNGCSWFKDWYFPEGGNEGGQKLQGEKPLTKRHGKRQLQRLNKEIKRFVHEKEVDSSVTRIEQYALNRGKYLLDQYF